MTHLAVRTSLYIYLDNHLNWPHHKHEIFSIYLFLESFEHFQQIFFQLYIWFAKITLSRSMSPLIQSTWSRLTFTCLLSWRDRFQHFFILTCIVPYIRWEMYIRWEICTKQLTFPPLIIIFHSDFRNKYLWVLANSWYSFCMSVVHTFCAFPPFVHLIWTQ